MQCNPSKPAHIVRIRPWRDITADESNIVDVGNVSYDATAVSAPGFSKPTRPLHTSDVGVRGNTLAVVAKSWWYTL